MVISGSSSNNFFFIFACLLLLVCMCVAWHLKREPSLSRIFSSLTDADRNNSWPDYFYTLDPLEASSLEAAWKELLIMRASISFTSLTFSLSQIEMSCVCVWPSLMQFLYSAASRKTCPQEKSYLVQFSDFYQESFMKLLRAYIFGEDNVFVILEQRVCVWCVW